MAIDRDRIYSSRKWRKLRAEVLENNPYCAMCMQVGIVTKATVVDHIVPHRGNEELFWDENNLQPLCRDCHERHKKRLERSGKLYGCRPDGIPLDRTHHWRRKSG